MTLHATVHGQGHPLVLLHGWGFDGGIWRALLPAFCARFQVYAVDLPGCGQSSNMDWNAFKQQLCGILPASFAILGWSLGGLYATRLALEEPLRVTHLLNIASSPCFVQDDHWPGLESGVLATFSDDLTRDPERTWKRFTRLQGPGNATGQMLSPEQIRGLRAGLEALQTWDLRALLAQLNMPVCYAFGGLDGVTLPALMPCMQSQYPMFHYKLFQDAAHTPFLSHPKEFYALLEGFIP